MMPAYICVWAKTQSSFPPPHKTKLPSCLSWPGPNANLFRRRRRRRKGIWQSVPTTWRGFRGGGGGFDLTTSSLLFVYDGLWGLLAKKRHFAYVPFMSRTTLKAPKAKNLVLLWFCFSFISLYFTVINPCATSTYNRERVGLKIRVSAVQG